MPRQILENVRAADWAPDGAGLAVVRVVQGRHRLEFPIGRVLYETTGFIPNIRFSPKGDRIALQESGAGRAWIATVGLDGKKTVLTEAYTEGFGLAWSARGDEVWYSLTDGIAPPAIRAVTLGGRVRLVQRAPTSLILGDIGRDGRVLLSSLTWRAGILCLEPGESQERRLDWLDWSLAADLSRDGRNLLFSETRHGGGGPASVYLRKTDGTPPVRLGEGRGHALSPDGKWALSSARASPRGLVLLPTGAGESRTLAMEGLTIFWAKWFPDGSRLLVAASEPDHRVRLYVQQLEGGKPRALTPEGVNAGDAISPDGKVVAVAGPDRRIQLYPAEGGEPRPGPTLEPGEAPIQWSADGRSLFVRGPGELQAVRVYRLDLASGRKEQWKEFRPPDPAGAVGLNPILVTPDGRSYAYGYQQQLSDLFLVEGLR